MTNYSTLGHNLKRGIFNFRKKLGAGFYRPTQKFILNMVFGLIAAKSCFLTEIARNLKENIALDKTVERLSRNLMTFDGGGKLHEYYFQTVKKHFDDSAILIIDDSDVSKPCGSKLEGLCRVHDGSTGGIADGYWVAGVSALTSKHKQPIPVYSRISNLVRRFKGKYSLKFEAKNGKKADCKLSIVHVCLPNYPDKTLNLVICRGFGKDPLLLLTSLESDDPRLCVTITKVYLMRWRIEEYYKFKKQGFGFEKFLVRTLKSIRNLDLFLSIAIGYIGVLSEHIEDSIETLKIIEASKRLYGLSNFTFYAISDGLFAIFSKLYTGVYNFFIPPPRSNQLSLPGWR
jgi:hypothetical protein